MKLKLLSNFNDYYDHWFDLETDHTLRRYGTDGLDRFAQLHLMERNGIKVPPYGTVSQLLGPPARYGAPEVRRPRLSKRATKLVVYTDVRAHCTEGKVLCSLDEAMDKYPESLASEYIPQCQGVSWRCLHLGKHKFWIEYKSDEDWRSNYGEGSIDVIGREEGWGFLKIPLYAIDYALGDELYAVDFNIAPGIRGSGVERLMPPKHAAEAIKDAYFEGTYQEDVERYYINASSK